MEKKEVSTKKELNIAINYYIISCLWKYKKHPLDELYLLTTLSNKRYLEWKKEGKTPTDKAVDALYESIGIRKEILNGQDYIYIGGINASTWLRSFQAWEEKKGGSFWTRYVESLSQKPNPVPDPKNGSVIDENTLKDCLKKAVENIQDVRDISVYALLTYLDTGKRPDELTLSQVQKNWASAPTSVEEKVKLILRIMGGFDVKSLEKLYTIPVKPESKEKRIFVQYEEQIKKQLKLIQAVRVYNETV